jgi:hypothetical protein
MTFEDYKIKNKQLEDNFEKDKTQLTKDFINSNNPYSIGDIISDKLGSIKIEKIQYYCPKSKLEKPCAVYVGQIYTKNQTPTKSKKHRTIFQYNIFFNKM